MAVGEAALLGIAEGEQSRDSSSNTGGNRSSSEMKLVASSVTPLRDARRGQEGYAHDGEVGSPDREGWISIAIFEVVEHEDAKDELGEREKYMLNMSCGKWQWRAGPEMNMLGKRDLCTARRTVI